MTIFEFAFDAVFRITGISKKRMIARCRQWPLVEARMLYVLFISEQGVADQTIGWVLERERLSIRHIRLRAIEYAEINKSFRAKMDKIRQLFKATDLYLNNQ